MQTVVGVSDLHVSSNINERIITYALGSCLGIAVYDPAAMTGGLLHVMLPLSNHDPDKAQVRPAMYVDSGFRLLLDKMYRLGAKKSNLIISVAGGASMKKTPENDYFKIGRRNYTVFRKLLWKNGFLIANQDLGGTISRTMAIRISDGTVTVNKKPMKAPMESDTL